MHILTKAADAPTKQEWRSVLMSTGQRTAVIACPHCGSRSALSTHEIDAGGNVMPDVICDECGFQDFIRLEGWHA